MGYSVIIISGRLVSDLYPVPKVYVAMHAYNALHEEQLSLVPNDVIIAASGIPINGWVKGCKKDRPEKVGVMQLKCPAASCHLYLS